MDFCNKICFIFTIRYARIHEYCESSVVAVVVIARNQTLLIPHITCRSLVKFLKDVSSLQDNDQRGAERYYMH